MRRARFIAAVMAAVCLLGASCSDGDDEPSASPTTASGTATARGGAGGSDGFCTFVRDFTSRFGRVDISLSDPQRLRTTMEDAAGAIANAQSNAPEAVRADVATLNTYFQRFVTSLRQVNFDLTRLPRTAVEDLQNPEFTSASDRLDEYVRQNCR